MGVSADCSRAGCCFRLARKGLNLWSWGIILLDICALQMQANAVSIDGRKCRSKRQWFDVAQAGQCKWSRGARTKKLRHPLLLAWPVARRKFVERSYRRRRSR